jgi:uncharacterized phage protein gp47/JayE
LNDFIDKNFQEIVEEMLADFASELGVDIISSASDIAIKAKVYSAQIEGLIFNQRFVLKQAFPQTATGQYLIDHAYPWNYEKKEATKATGTVKMGRKTGSTVDISIPAGTLFSTDTDIYGKLVKGVTKENVILQAGMLEIEIAAEADSPGIGGNVPVGAFTVLNQPPAGIEYVKNDFPFLGGTDEEDEEVFRERFINGIRKPSLGGTKTDYENWALEVDGVTLAKCIPLNRGPGTVDVLIATASGQPSDDLVQAVWDHIETKRPIGADVLVLKPQIVTINVDVTISPKSGYTIEGLTESVNDAITSYINSVSVGGTVKLSAIINAVYDIPGIDDVEIISPVSNTSLGETQIAQAGVIDVQ